MNNSINNIEGQGNEGREGIGKRGRTSPMGVVTSMNKRPRVGDYGNTPGDGGPQRQMKQFVNPMGISGNQLRIVVISSTKCLNNFFLDNQQFIGIFQGASNMSFSNTNIAANVNYVTDHNKTLKALKVLILFIFSCFGVD